MRPADLPQMRDGGSLRSIREEVEADGSGEAMVLMLVSDTRTVELTDSAAEFFVAEQIAFPVAAEEHQLELSSKTPWNAKPVRKLLLFLGGHDVSGD